VLARSAQIFASSDRESAGETLAAVVDQLRAPAGKVAQLLETAEEEPRPIPVQYSAPGVSTGGEASTDWLVIGSAAP
jgi:hypothetical protein